MATPAHDIMLGDDLARGHSLWGDAWLRLVKNKAAIVATTIVAVMTIAVIAGRNRPFDSRL